MFDRFWCFRPIKDTILKANHNRVVTNFATPIGVSDLSKIQFWKQITTVTTEAIADNAVFQTYQRYNFESKSQLILQTLTHGQRCFRPIKDTILKANHNEFCEGLTETIGVSDLSKIQFWKQITTQSSVMIRPTRCFRPIKDTILKANHNSMTTLFYPISGVSDLSKIQFWKQITTIV